MVVAVNVCSPLVDFVDFDIVVDTAAFAVVDVFDVINVDDVFLNILVQFISMLVIACYCCLLLLLVLIACPYYCLGVP